MIFLLDTDTLIFMARGLKRSARRSRRKQALRLVEQCRAAQDVGDSIAVSAITVSELEFGAQHSGEYESEAAAVHKLLVPFDVYDYDAIMCPSQYGRIRQALETSGAAIGAMDLLIAAHALAVSATLVTNNVEHFSRVPDLRIVNWLKSSPDVNN